jgi:hypothetical protein
MRGPGGRWVRSVWLATGLLISVPEPVLCDTRPVVAAPHRTIVFGPDRPERCDYFFVTEFSVGATNRKSQDAVDRFLLTDGLGVMRNIDRRRALGVSIDAHLAAGAIRFAPTIRYKHWLAGRSSIDLLLGYAHTAIQQEGVTGPIVDVRYSPTQWFHVQAGACRIRNVRSIFYYPDFHVDEDTRLRVHAGIGLGGVPGVVSWGVQAIGAVGVALALTGME